jgi:hypothetical protein
MPRILENRRLRNIFGRNKKDGKGEWRKLHSGKLHVLYSSTVLLS